MALEARNLVAGPEGKIVLRGVNIKVPQGSIIALMGPNGSGKTTLAYTLMGHPRYRVESGEVLLDGEPVTSLPPHERARRGLMLGFQNPVEIPGVRLISFIAAAYNRRFGIEERLIGMPRPELHKQARELAERLGLRSEMLQREVNVGFSGGERKRAEMLQLLLLRPRYVILDEPDSGLDVDGVRVIAEAIRELVEQGTGVLVITHYARILQFVEPSHVVVLVNGRVVDEGGPELARRIEQEGYRAYMEDKA
ncbi:Fe-S cluster assembly ATPase SufC [Hyperthermus butylicus]|uniref:ABC transporter n=1 Tax=Hyperthermus butylicus (strain DSM 5456 / JCM 9403 / PLM1-5) TaxID=415426 RepID=A2BK74_HYPBU|nr:Fe-S cluster assembly ATPase SufC [Hyperthermus butylicus]ABM80385.1 putative ABC transporter [Hyperthermus butylicus DSM 5456]